MPGAVLAEQGDDFAGADAEGDVKQHLGVAVEGFDAVGPAARGGLLKLADLAMSATARFMLVYGTELVRVTWGQTIAEFPSLPVGVTYLPIPLGGLFTLLFIVDGSGSGHRRRGRSCTATSRWRSDRP